MLGGNGMDAQRAIGRLNWPRIDSPAAAKLVRTLATTSLGLLALAAIFIGFRRSSGALAQPLPASVLAACGGLLALAAILFRRFFSPATSPGDRARKFAWWAAPSGVLVLWAGSLSLDGTAPSGLLALWGLLLAEEGWCWSRLWREHSRPGFAAPKRANDPIVAASSGHVLVSAIDDELDAGVTQQIIRRRESDGSESLEGWVRADVVAGQRHATAHLAICPPLDCRPQCFAESLDGPPAAIKVAQVLPYGVRFDVKLDEPAQEPGSVVIEFSIQAPASGPS
jgi:hypothetical protein